jgi:hypothetical protein
MSRGVDAWPQAPDATDEHAVEPPLAKTSARVVPVVVPAEGLASLAVDVLGGPAGPAPTLREPAVAEAVES